MSIIKATAKASDANSYSTLERAEDHVRTRMVQADPWTSSDGLPDAEGFLVNGAQGVGVKVVAIDGGTGTLSVGDVVKFAGHATTYSLSAFTTSQLTLVNGLTSAIADDEAVERQTGSDKEKALVRATALLDQLIDWRGFRTTDGQALLMPQTGLADIDGRALDENVVPDDVVRATIELAVALMGSDRTEEPEILRQGLKSFGVEGMRFEVDNTKVRSAIPAHVLSMIEHLGRLKSTAPGGGMRTVRTGRT